MGVTLIQAPNRKPQLTREPPRAFRSAQLDCYVQFKTKGEGSIIFSMQSLPAPPETHPEPRPAAVCGLQHG